MSTRVLVSDLPVSTLPEGGGPAAGVFLYCRSCGAEYSASRGDYFWMRSDSPMQCSMGHVVTNLRIVRRVCRLVPA